MSDKTLREQQNEAALVGLRKCTAGLNEQAHSEYRNWWDPTSGRPRVDELIRELVSYYKALDRDFRSQHSNEIDAARVAIYDALIETSKTDSDERRDWMVMKMDSVLAGFEKVIKNTGCSQVEPYQMSAPAAAPAPVPAPALAPKIEPPAVKSPSLFDAIKSFFSLLIDMVQGFIDSFIPKKSKTEVVSITAPHKPVKKIEEASKPKSPQFTFPQRNLAQDKKDYGRLKREAEEAQQYGQLPNLTKVQKQACEPGRKINNKSKTH